MRKLFYALIALLLLGQFSCGPTHVVVESPAPAPPPPPPPPPAPEVSYQNFYDALSPYGEWINNPEYGYVWMPNVGPDFKPYATNGNWVYTDEGWAWSSNYSWGWAPFHYGRWFYEDGYGWMWIPGNEWAPAWVSWRRSPDYYGWAPLGPSVSVNVAIGGGYNPPPHYWCFVPHQYVTSPHVNTYYVNEQQNVTIINNTTVIHNTTIVNNTYNNTTVVNNNVNNTRVTVNNYAGGPDPGEVSRVTGTQLRPIAVRESNTPGGNGSGGAFAVYRPKINAAPQGNGGSTGSGFHPAPAPAHVQSLTNVRPVNTATFNNTRGTINNTSINNTTNNNTINNNQSSNTNITNNNNNFRPNPTPNNAGQPSGQPGVQSTYQPNRQPVNQPINQPVNQPANQGQPAGQPTGQPGNQPALHPNNNTRFNGNANAAAGNSGTGNPAPGNGGGNGNSRNGSVSNGSANGHGNTSNGGGNGNGGNTGSNGSNGNGHGNGHPGQAGTNGNPPKPHPQQGSKPQDNKPKPKPNNPDNRQ
ncbi:MAG TPA: DUF6600 domain-containing protein [Puia sp.]|nr:DUF6600 domain-containing protein [Puia sp.]